MEALRGEKPNSTASEVDLVLHERLVSQGAHIKLLVNSLNSWKAWFESKFPNEALPVKEIVERPPTPDEVPQQFSNTQPTAQPLMILDDTGQYMVLQKLVADDNDVAKYIQQQGLEWFARIQDV